jgi:diguanylate cyclase (GGDEF)-like protein
MNTTQFKFYLALCRIPVLQNSYSIKIMSVAFIGLIIPLLALSVSLFIISSLSFNDKICLFVVTLLATVLGMIISFFFLYWLLYPIALTVKALHHYLQNEEKPKLPTHLADCVGQLMTEVQYTIEKLDLLKQSFDSAATVDPLTGLLNRLAGEERLRQDIARARREERQMLVALIEIDNFKMINEHFGHYLGDLCLTQIIEVVAQNIREGDWLARWDEKKFLMVLWNFNHSTPIIVLERLQKQSVKTPMGELLQLGLSIGACEYRGDTDLDTETELETLLIHIDDALSQVKVAGGGSIRLLE